MKRLTEASTWAGLGIMAQVLANIVPGQYGLYLHGISAVAAALAGVIPEKAAAEKAAA
ncbi:hypothetical protein ACO0LG_09940 [Undibacterium sp. Ji42W]|uniref:hypothetical protein n=1 Tax=Undibacterium sp. Ji42W TaxID=3413039 RepID=UPI003BF19C04